MTGPPPAPPASGRGTPRVLVIAGSDSGGGAGIQADIKTITMLGGHAMTAITAVTAQNTLGVQAVMPVPAAMVRAQIDSVIGDIGVDAVKIGMLGSAETANAVADWLETLPSSPREGEAVPIVFDPVMVATSGDALADAATVAAFERLASAATVVTPNLPELAALCGGKAIAVDHLEREAAAYARRVGAAVLVTGGHGEGNRLVDRLFDSDGGHVWWGNERIATQSTHGTGCTLASAIAMGLAKGLPLADAAVRANSFVRLALRGAPGLGRGHGPMGHQTVRLDLDLGGAMPNHITLPATDHAASLAFYRTLGLTPIVDSDNRYARFESAGGVTLSIEAADEIAGKPLLFIEVDDLDRAVASLRAAGIAVADAAMRPWLWREARLTDPAGNALCLYQAGEMRRFPPWRLNA